MAINRTLHTVELLADTVLFRNVSSTLNPTTPRSELFISSLDIFDIGNAVFICFIWQVVCLVAVLGNVISAAVFMRRDLNVSTNVLSLALSDLGSSLTITTPPCGQSVVMNFDLGAGNLALAYGYVSLGPWCAGFGFFSAHIVSCIAAERFCAMMFPVKVSALLTAPRIKVIVLLLYCCSIALPTHSSRTAVIVCDMQPNASSASLTNAQIYLDSHVVIVQLFWLTSIHLTPTVPLAVTLFCCLGVVWKLRAISRVLLIQAPSSAFKPKVKDVKATRMLLVVCFVSSLVCLPGATWDLYWKVGSFPAIFPDISMDFVQAFLSIFYQLGTASNFFIYLTMQGKFARDCRRLVELF